MRKQILKKLHIPHEGADKTIGNAKYKYYWPGLAGSIKEMCESYAACSEGRQSKWREPMENEGRTPITQLEAMQEVGVDLCQLNNHHYIIMCDRMSGYPFAKE